MQTVLAQAAARAPGSVKGTPLQQVGDLYASGMDVGRLTLLKAEPIKSEWARIEAIDSKQVLAESIAHFSLVLSDGTMFGSGILPEPRDNTQYTIAFLGATLPMAARENYLSPDMAKVHEAYRTMVVKYHLIAGVPLAEAQARADKILAIESRVAGKQLTPEQAAQFLAAPQADDLRRAESTGLELRPRHVLPGNGTAGRSRRLRPRRRQRA